MQKELLYQIGITNNLGSIIARVPGDLSLSDAESLFSDLELTVIAVGAIPALEQPVQPSTCQPRRKLPSLPR